MIKGWQDKRCKQVGHSNETADYPFWHLYRSPILFCCQQECLLVKRNSIGKIEFIFKGVGHVS